VRLNSIDEVLALAGVTETTLSAGERRLFDERGYVIWPKLMDASWLEQLRADFEQIAARDRQISGGKESGTRHIKDLFNEGSAFEQVFTHPKILAAVYHVLGRPFGVSQFGGRDPLPGYGQQGLHADWVPRSSEEPSYVVTIIGMLDEFTSDNGATRVVPGTHCLKNTVPKKMADPASRHPEQIIVTAPAGSVLIFNGHLWHSGTRNLSRGSRRALQPVYHARELLRFNRQEQYNQPGRLPVARYLLGFE